MSKRLTQKRHQSDVIILPSEHRGHPAERGALKRRLTAWRSSTPHPKCTSHDTDAGPMREEGSDSDRRTRRVADTLASVEARGRGFEHAEARHGDRCRRRRRGIHGPWRHLRSSEPCQQRSHPGPRGHRVVCRGWRRRSGAWCEGPQLEGPPPCLRGARMPHTRCHV